MPAISGLRCALNDFENMTGENSFELGLEIVPNSKGFATMGFNPWTGSLRVKVRAKALEGRANEELASELGKLLGARIRIIAGEKSRKKKILVTGIGRADFERIVLR